MTNPSIEDYEKLKGDIERQIIGTKLALFMHEAALAQIEKKLKEVDDNVEKIELQLSERSSQRKKDRKPSKK